MDRSIKEEQTDSASLAETRDALPRNVEEQQVDEKDAVIAQLRNELALQLAEFEEKKTAMENDAALNRSLLKILNEKIESQRIELESAKKVGTQNKKKEETESHKVELDRKNDEINHLKNEVIQLKKEIEKRDSEKLQIEKILRGGTSSPNESSTKSEEPPMKKSKIEQDNSATPESRVDPAAASPLASDSPITAAAAAPPAVITPASAVEPIISTPPISSTRTRRSFGPAAAANPLAADPPTSAAVSEPVALTPVTPVTPTPRMHFTRSLGRSPASSLAAVPSSQSTATTPAAAAASSDMPSTRTRRPKLPTAASTMAAASAVATGAADSQDAVATPAAAEPRSAISARTEPIGSPRPRSAAHLAAIMAAHAAASAERAAAGCARSGDIATPEENKIIVDQCRKWLEKLRTTDPMTSDDRLATADNAQTIQPHFPHRTIGSIRTRLHRMKKNGELDDILMEFGFSKSNV